MQRTYRSLQRRGVASRAWGAATVGPIRDSCVRVAPVATVAPRTQPARLGEITPSVRGRRRSASAARGSNRRRRRTPPRTRNLLHRRRRQRLFRPIRVGSGSTAFQASAHQLTARARATGRCQRNFGDHLLGVAEKWSARKIKPPTSSTLARGLISWRRIGDLNP